VRGRNPSDERVRLGGNLNVKEALGGEHCFVNNQFRWWEELQGIGSGSTDFLGQPISSTDPEELPIA